VTAPQGEYLVTNLPTGNYEVAPSGGLHQLPVAYQHDRRKPMSEHDHADGEHAEEVRMITIRWSFDAELRRGMASQAAEKRRAQWKMEDGKFTISMQDAFFSILLDSSEPRR
jgi:hypothetical protein